MTTLNDGLVNLVSGLGTTRDKAGQSQYYVAPMSDQELVTAYYASALARRIVDMPAEDACREWREWSAETAEVGLIEAEEKRLGLQVKTLEAQRLARLFGGAALFIGTADIQGRNQDALQEPLRYDTIKRGGLRYVEVLTSRQLTPGPLSDKLGDGTFGKPEYWQLSTTSNAGLRIHPSRLSIFHGVEPLRDYSTGLMTGWGASVLQGGLDAIKRVDEAAGNVASLIFEAKVDVFGIPDLMLNLARGDEYTQELLKRLTLAATAKGINGMLIKDALETYEQKTASFGTLDTLIDRFMQLCSAAYGIPMTLLFGMSPGGLNASGASDTRGYYDAIRVHQTMRVEPATYGLDECLVRSALGARPDDVHYNWRSLWQPTAKEKAEVGKIIADTIVAMDGLLADEVRASTAVNALTESGAFPGLEAAVLEYGQALPDEAEEVDGEDTPDAV